MWLPKGNWYVQFEDIESGNTIYSADIEEGLVLSAKKYYVPFRILIWKGDEKEPFFVHELDLKGKEVHFKFPVGTLGDIIGWFPYVEKFCLKHGCKAEVTMAPEMADLFEPSYPQIRFTRIGKDDLKFENPYATYRMGLFFNNNNTHQPLDFRITGIAKSAAYILGVDADETPPRIKLDYERTIKKPYVCIAAKASCQAKYWNNPNGWDDVVKYLKTLGYRVLCIDRDAVAGHDFTWNHIPHGAEDFTGNKPLTERAALLAHADFFVGLSSGLAWLAWAAKRPVVLISGFTLPTCEFYTPYRVYNTHGCYGCWDDACIPFKHGDYFWCPRLKGTDRQFECTRLITAKQVIGHIDRLMADNNFLN
ncbi:autotransporter strand-loop-strand O-heptosyltransferase [Elusimicrobium simillimum]